MEARLSTGISKLDEMLGGGLLGGTLCVVVGASGIGKTQLGLQFLHATSPQEAGPGVVFDTSARIDSQAHAPYTAHLFGRELKEHPRTPFSADGFFEPARLVGQYLHVFDYAGRAVTQRELSFDAWHDWQAELAARLELSIDFFYSNFTRGVRRAVIDGIEPADRPNESIQLELFQYVYHQILRKDSQWVARDLFRQHYRTHADEIERNAYDCNRIAAMLLVTAHETMLDDLIERPLADGDMLAGANTLIYMGKLRDASQPASKLSRGLYIAKHRGSACSDDIVRYEIGQQGLYFP